MQKKIYCGPKSDRCDLPSNTWDRVVRKRPGERARTPRSANDVNGPRTKWPCQNETRRNHKKKFSWLRLDNGSFLNGLFLSLNAGLRAAPKVLMRPVCHLRPTCTPLVNRVRVSFVQIASLFFLAGFFFTPTGVRPPPFRGVAKRKKMFLSKYVKTKNKYELWWKKIMKIRLFFQKYRSLSSEFSEECNWFQNSSIEIPARDIYFKHGIQIWGKNMEIMGRIRVLELFVSKS